MNQELNHPEIIELTETVQGFGRRNWVPATSSNFSVRLENTEHLWITRSGVDKNKFSETDLMPIDFKGRPLVETDRPSAETLIHCLIYDLFPNTKAVLHTHGIYSTILSVELKNEGSVGFSDLELLKVLPGIDTHETQVHLPIYENSQDMASFTESIREDLRRRGRFQSFLMAGHGLYAWGSNVAEARRIIEGVEYLSEFTFVRSRGR